MPMMMSVYLGNVPAEPAALVVAAFGWHLVASLEGAVVVTVLDLDWLELELLDLGLVALRAVVWS